MKRRRKKRYKRKRRLYWKLLIGLTLILLAGISVFAWRYSLTRTEPQEDGKESQPADEENAGTETGASKPQESEQGHEPFKITGT